MSPLRVGAIYTFMAALWVLLSDRAVDALGLPPERTALMQTLKGLVFILLSGLVIYLLTRAAVATARANAERAERLADELSRANARFDLAAEAARVGVWEWDAESKRLEWDERMFALYGVDPSTFTNRFDEWSRRVHPDDLPKAQAQVDKAMQTGADFGAEFRITLPDGSVRSISGKGRVMRGSDGRVRRLMGLNIDITEFRRAVEKAQESEARIQRIAANIPGAIFRYTLFPDGSDRIDYMSAGFANVWEVSPEEVLESVDVLWSMIDQDDAPMVRRSVEESARTMRAWSDQWRITTRSGKRKWIQGYGQPTPGRDGAVVWDTAIFDVSEQKNIERRQHLMMRELDHRVKNNLAAVLAIADSSIREAHSLEQFQESFVGRIRAMSSLHSLLAAGRWEDVGLVSMIQAIVAPYSGSGANGQITIRGEDRRLPSNAAPAICMTLHELATNAVKHGALSDERGTIEISWDLEAVSDDLRIVWRERAARPISASIEPGFGLDLLQGVIPYELNGDVQLRFTPDGLEVIIVIPGESIRERPSNEAVHQGRI